MVRLQVEQTLVASNVTGEIQAGNDRMVYAVTRCTSGRAQSDELVSPAQRLPA